MLVYGDEIMSIFSIIILVVILLGIIVAYCFSAKARQLAQNHNSLFALVSTFAALIVFVQLYITVDLFEQTQEKGTKEQQSISLQKLQRVYLESVYNIKIAQHALHTYSMAKVDNLFIQRPTFAMARLALQDDNVLSFIPAYKISLLMEYINAIELLNHTLDFHKELALNPDLHKEISSYKDVQFIRTNAAAAVVNCLILQREFSEYSKKENYDRSKIQILNEERKEIMEKVLQGKTSFSSEPQNAYN